MIKRHDAAMNLPSCVRGVPRPYLQISGVRETLGPWMLTFASVMYVIALTLAYQPVRNNDAVDWARYMVTFVSPKPDTHAGPVASPLSRMTLT